MHYVVALCLQSATLTFNRGCPLCVMKIFILQIIYKQKLATHCANVSQVLKYIKNRPIISAGNYLW